MNIEQMLQGSSVRIDRSRAAKVRERLFGAPKPVVPPRYELREELGRGQFGRVHLAFDRELRRELALKIIRYETPVEKARIEREAEALARISHPNVVQVYDKGSVSEGTYFLALEYVDGQRLDRWLGARTRSLKDVLRVFVQIAEGLSAAHRSELVHRDFKPANVVVGPDGRACVLDFGLAKLSAMAKATNADKPAWESIPLGRLWPESGPYSDGAGSGHPGATIPAGPRPKDSSPGASYLDASLTEAESFVGTLLYASPEAFDGPDLGPRSDQFSYCVALFEAAYGYRPFSARSYLEQISTGRTDRRAAIRPVPRWLRKLLQRGLSPDAGDRFHDLQELAGILRSHLPARTGVRVALVATVLTAAIVVATSPLWKPPEVDLALAPWEPQGQVIEARYGPVLREQLEAYRVAWEGAAVQYRAELRPDPSSKEVRCLQQTQRELERFVEDLESLPSHPGSVPSLRPSPLLLAQMFPPAQCLLDPPDAIDGRAVMLLLLAQVENLRGNYESAEVLVRQAALRGSKDARVLEAIDLQRGIIETSLGRPEAWATLRGLAERVQDPAVRLEILTKQLEAGVTLDYPYEALEAVAAEATRLAGDLGDAHPETNAWLEVAQGRMSLQRGDSPSAQKHYDQALRLFRTTAQDPNVDASYPIAYVELSKAFAETWGPSGYDAKAMAARADAALTKLRRYFADQHPLLLQHEISVGVAFLHAGDDLHARAMFETVRRDQEDCVHPCWSAVRARAELLSLDLDTIKAADVSPDQALDFRRQANAIELAIGAEDPFTSPPPRDHAARVWTVLMKARAKLGDYERAIEAVDQWIEHGVAHDREQACLMLKQLAEDFENDQTVLSESTREIMQRLTTECIRGDRDDDNEQ